MNTSEVVAASPYDSHYYETLEPGAERSAFQMVPTIVDLVKPRSVVDVGCGNGVWLSVFAKHGVGEILGIDGESMSSDLLRIPFDCFEARDLRQAFDCNRRFDLALSLEVAEHLPAGSARQFVHQLTALAPAVMFSAAVPCQDGTGHVNEQWADYWISLFDEIGYAVVDCLRPKYWENPEVEFWYSQNAFLFVERIAIQQYPKLQQGDLGLRLPARLVHPDLFQPVVEIKQFFEQWYEKPSLRGLLHRMPDAGRRALRRRLTGGASPVRPDVASRR